MVTCANCRTQNADNARFCSNCGAPLEALRPMEGERKFATVLFADVARSTAIAEQLDAEDWAAIMNGAFGFMNASVSRYGGTVSRLMGDAVLALFGAPVAHEDDAERAVRAGLDIQSAARAYAPQIKARYDVDFDLRVGINTGTAVLGFVGDAIRTEYTAMGDTANVAARLQSAALPGSVLIGPETERLVRALFEIAPRGAVEMKGKSAPLETFEVRAVKAVPGRVRGLEGLSSPVVGRDPQIAVLRERIAALQAGRGGVVAIVGEAGLGKSRLVAELRRLRDGATPPPAWHEGRAISYGQSIPYYPWREIGRQLLGAGETDAAPALREKIAALLARLGVSGAQAPFLETMLAVEGETSRAAVAALAGETIGAAVAGAVVEVIRAGLHPPSGPAPQVLVLEDLHWADSATLELAAQVATLSASEPLLLVCALRPDRRAPSWGLLERLQATLGTQFSRLDLEPLDGEQSRLLLANLLQIEELPEAIRAQILARSEGNPFYLEEVLRTLIDDGQVVEDGGHWRATRDILSAKIPETLAGILSSRIDRLPEDTKRVAQTAAVIGRVFGYRVLDTMCREAPPAERIEPIAPHVATLAGEQLVHERTPGPEREYAFKHALTCEAAYELLLKTRRRELHGRAGTALEALYADRLNEFAPMLAHHFAEAGDARRALAYSRQAADTARRLYALEEELMHREQVLTSLERLADAPTAEALDALLDWVIVRHRLGRYAGVIDRLEPAIALARQAGDRHRLGRILSWIGNMHFVTGFPSRGVPYLQESQQIGQELGDVQMVMLPTFFATWAVVDRDPAAAIGQLEEVIRLAKDNNVTDVLGHAMAYRAVALARTGAFEAARAQIAEALEMLPLTPSPVKRADIHIGVGMAFHDMGEFDAGLQHSRLGAELAEQEHGLECACAGYLGAGQVQLERRQLDDAHEDFTRSLKYADMAGFEAFLNVIKGGVALTEFERGSTGAVDDLRRAVDNAIAGHDDYAAASMSAKLGGALLRLGRREEAERYLGDALSYYRKSGMSPYEASTLRALVRLYEAGGRTAEANAARTEAGDILSKMAREAFPSRQRETV